MDEKFKLYLRSKGLIIASDSDLPSLEDLTLNITPFSEEEMVNAITYKLFEPSVVFVVTDEMNIFTGKRGKCTEGLYGRLKEGFPESDKDDLNYPDLFLRARRRATHYGLDLAELTKVVRPEISDDLKRIQMRMEQFLKRYQKKEK